MSNLSTLLKIIAGGAAGVGAISATSEEAEAGISPKNIYDIWGKTRGAVEAAREILPKLPKVVRRDPNLRLLGSTVEEFRPRYEANYPDFSKTTPAERILGAHWNPAKPGNPSVELRAPDEPGFNSIVEIIKDPKITGTTAGTPNRLAGTLGHEFMHFFQDKWLREAPKKFDKSLMTTREFKQQIKEGLQNEDLTEFLSAALFKTRSSRYPGNTAAQNVAMLSKKLPETQKSLAKQLLEWWRQLQIEESLKGEQTLTKWAARKTKRARPPEAT